MSQTNPTITFGRQHKGQRVNDLPHDYLLWIAFPEKRCFRTRRFKAPEEIVTAALARIQREKIAIPEKLPTQKERQAHAERIESMIPKTATKIGLSLLALTGPAQNLHAQTITQSPAETQSIVLGEKAPSLKSPTYSPTSSAPNPNAWYHGFAVSMRAGTLGWGPELSYRIPQGHFGARLFYNHYNLTLNNLYNSRINVNIAGITDSSVPARFDGAIHLQNEGIMADFYPFTHSGWKLSLGVIDRSGDHIDGYGDPQGSVTVNLNGTYFGHHYNRSQTVAATEYGHVEGKIQIKPIEPMGVIGYQGQIWGPLLFNADFGVTYMGHLRSEMIGVGPGTSYAQVNDAIAKANKRAEDKTRNYVFYPVIMFGLGYHF